jgi:NAD dependent epimerase/dehydratase family enzyme
MSWIAIPDVVAAVLHLLGRDDVRGPVNVVSPSPVTNLEFTRALGRALGRPTVFPLPAVAARLAFGEMADEMLLSSTRAVPRRLEASGYTFRLPEIDAALAAVLAPG